MFQSSVSSMRPKWARPDLPPQLAALGVQIGPRQGLHSLVVTVHANLAHVHSHRVQDSGLLVKVHTVHQEDIQGLILILICEAQDCLFQGGI